MTQYADIDLSGATAGYKNRFLRMVENVHQYYMPDLGGMCDRAYYEKNADHWIYVRIPDLTVFNRIIDVLHRRYRWKPLVYPRFATDHACTRDNKTYEMLNYEKREYNGIDYHPGLHPETDEQEAL